MQHENFSIEFPSRYRTGMRADFNFIFFLLDVVFKSHQLELFCRYLNYVSNSKPAFLENLSGGLRFLSWSFDYSNKSVISSTKLFIYKS